MLELFPETAAVEDGELTIAGIPATDLADDYGTPLLVYDEQTIVEAARAYRSAAPNAFVAYGVKAFPNVGVLQLLAARLRSGASSGGRRSPTTGRPRAARRRPR